jgi:phosphomethylpyrimidine synthase
MKITEDVREYAKEKAIKDENEALKKGLEEQAEHFKEKGSEIYL